MFDSKEVPYPEWVEVGIVSLVWGGYAVLRFIQFYIQESVYNHLAINYAFCCLLFFAATFVVFRLCSHLRPNDVGWSKSILLHTLLLIIITSSVEILILYLKVIKVEFFSTSEFIPEDYGFLSVTYFVFSRFKFTNHVEAYLIVLAGSLGRDYFLRYIGKQKRTHELKQQAQRLRTQLSSARLDALRMQINPHFLFNTLHVINTMAATNPDGVRSATNRLSELLRYALSSSERQEVPLSEELSFLRGYFEIQKLRLRDQLEVDVNVDPALEDALVPTLLLQPLAENAVKHGIQHVEGTGQIQVRVRAQGQALVVRVEDNGPGISGQPSGEESVGLENIRERLSHLYGADSGLTLGDSDLGGCCVEVRLPYHTNQDLHLEAVPEDDLDSVSSSPKQPIATREKKAESPRLSNKYKPEKVASSS